MVSGTVIVACQPIAVQRCFGNHAYAKLEWVLPMPSLVPAALRYADQVARSGSIQRAAKELNVAASAINRQIIQLEGILGVPLFERVAKGMRLTPAGDAVVTLARRWHADERRAAADLQQLQGIHQGHVRIVAMDSHVNGFLPAVVLQLAREHPRIALEIEIGSTDSAGSALIGGSTCRRAASCMCCGRRNCRSAASCRRRTPWPASVRSACRRRWRIPSPCRAAR